MIKVRKGTDRGYFDHGWLITYHTFSFASYHDPDEIGFSCLRVINDDRVAPGRGFDTHPHSDMEIITYVVEGALEHKDSMGNGSIIKAGEVQRMSAGTGITHSERNPSDTDEVHLFQIWIKPEQAGLEPSYEQKSFEEEKKGGGLVLVASPDGEAGSVTINQDARLFAVVLSGGEATHPIADGRNVYLHVIKGSVSLKGVVLEGGDGARVVGEKELSIRGDGEVLLFDLP